MQDKKILATGLARILTDYSSSKINGGNRRNPWLVFDSANDQQPMTNDGFYAFRLHLRS